MDNIRPLVHMYDLSPDASVRDAALKCYDNAVVIDSSWTLRTDIFQVLERASQQLISSSDLTDEDKALIHTIMEDFKSSGVGLSEDKKVS